MPMPGGWTMSMAWMRMPDQTSPGAFAAFVAMWALMMVAMMLPSLMPAVLAHRRPLRLACGYFAVWTAVGVVIYPIGVALAELEMASRAASCAVPLATAAVLALAGAWQLTRAKLRALARCRDRACCAIGRRPTPADAWRDGLRLGTRCVRCCIAPMAVLLAAGVMSLAAMAIVGAAITIERLVPRPRWFVRAFGIAALAAAAVSALWP
jgi:predicted metal-binding membrane protein